MQTKWVEVSVGAFMLVGALALMFLALQVSGLTFEPEENTFTVKARFSNIGGLKPRSQVTMAGVTVGRVTAIKLDPEWYEAVVTMEISQRLANKLTTDSSAAILTSGLLGENYVGLTVGADEQYLQDGDEIRDTQPALVLEDLIGKFLVSQAKD